MNNIKYKKSILIPIQKYERMLNALVSTNKPQPNEPITDIEDPTREREREQQSLSDQIIINSIPKNGRSKADTLLTYIKQPHSCMRWDQYGTFGTDNGLIENSNIIDLIKSSIYKYKNFKPIGETEFRRAIQKLNVPKTILADRSYTPINTPHLSINDTQYKDERGRNSPPSGPYIGHRKRGSGNSDDNRTDTIVRQMDQNVLER